MCVFDIELCKLLYILEINPLSVALFPNIFSHSVGCFFVLFIASFAAYTMLNVYTMPNLNGTTYISVKVMC